MAHAFKTRITPDGNGWYILDSVTEEQRATIELPIDPYELAELQRKAPTVVKLALYGLKQAVADGGAKDKGTSAAARLRAMLARYNDIAAGTWDFRDGTGSGSMPDGDVFRALAALGIIPDTIDQRAKWKKLAAPKRNALRQRSDVADWIAANMATVDADEVIDELLS